MQASSFSSAQTARTSLAARLRDLRLDARLTMDELAGLCGWNKSKISRIEATRTAPSDTDIEAWCAACGAPQQSPDLIAASRSAESMYVEWRRMQRTGLRRLQELAVPLYDQTTVFRVYSSRVLPGLLQTEAYAAVLLGQIAGFRRVPDDSARAATARVDRAQVIHRGRRRLSALVEEDVLFYRFGDTATMVEQLEYLLATMTLASVSLGIIPRTTPRRLWSQETFTVFDDRRVHVELLTAKVTITEPSDVGLYLRAFAELGTMAVYGTPARALITEAISSFR